MTGAHNEFELIAHYFARHHHHRRDVLLGIGDDAAICQPPHNTDLVIAVDTLVAGVHFPLDTPPEDIGYKALAVNLSDMAAMGASPAWMTLALTCPDADSKWLSAFSHGLFELAEQFGVALIGGDTTRGPLTISIHVTGFVPSGQAIQRTNAQPGDNIYVTGTLGDAGVGLKVDQGDLILPEPDNQYVQQRLNRPTPRIATGLALRQIANSAIDISDGLLADLNHVLTASNVGACINVSKLPLSTALQQQLPSQEAWRFALTAGDDYELCFTAPTAVQLPTLSLPDSITHIGVIESQPGLRCLDPNGRAFETHQPGYLHF